MQKGALPLDGHMLLQFNLALLVSSLRICVYIYGLLWGRTRGWANAQPLVCTATSR